MDAPNVILVVLDTARASTIHSLLERGEVSGLQKFTESGVKYENAFTNAPWTLPSHASMFTGQRSSDHDTHAGSQEFTPQVPTLAEALSTHGYRTVGISSNNWIRPTFSFDRGFDNLSSRWDVFWRGVDTSEIVEASGVDRAKKLLLSDDATELPFAVANALHARWSTSNGYDNGAKNITDRTVRWLRSQGDGDPFFYFVNYTEPHLEYRPPDAFADHDPDSVNQDQWKYITGGVEMGDRDFEKLVDLYEGEIRYLDTQLERIHDTLVNEGLLDDTAVFIVGDHGENIGEHGLMDHQYSLHETLLHVPLIAHYPRSVSVDSPSGMFELRDIYPTILKLAEATPQGDGVSTTTLLGGGRESVFAEYRYPQPQMNSISQSVAHLSESDRQQLDQTLRSIRTADWKLIEYEGGDVELYPAGEENENAASEKPDIVARLKTAMDDAGVSLERGGVEQIETSDATQQRLANLGYI